MFPYKVAFFIPQLSGGGAERVVANLANQFARDNISVLLITKSRRYNEYAVSESVKRFVLDAGSGRKIRFIRSFLRVNSLRTICKEQQVDVLMSFNVPANYMAIFATMGIRTKHIISIRNAPDFLFPRKINKIYAKLILSCVDGAVFQTVDAQQWFPKALQKKSTIIYNPVKADFYHVDYRPEPKRVVTFGRLIKQKNHQMLINAFRLVVDKFENASLHIYGEGVLKEELNELISSLKLEKHVFLEGRCYNVWDELSRASLFVLSSDVEGSPNALMEAMAVGVPSISTDCPCGGPQMLLGNTRAGFLVSLNAPNEMANSIIRILESSELRNEMSKLAKAVANHFQENTVCRDWQNYLSKICS